MPKKVPTVQVVVHRDGKSVQPEVGKVFDFTADEVKELNGMRQNALRDPVNEDPEAARPQNARAARAEADSKPEVDIKTTGKGAAKTDDI